METRENWKIRLKKPLIILGAFIAVLWLIEIVDVLFFDQALNGLGVRPRTVTGLSGIVLMPLLHSGLGHLAANTLPLFILGGIVLLRSWRDFVLVTVVTLLITGVGLWLLGNGQAVYIGASGLVFGYFGFLMVRAYFDRSWTSVVIAIVVFLLYGSLLWGILPRNQPGVSWGAHFLGFAAGVLAAWLASRLRRSSSDESPVEEGNIADQIKIL